MRSFARRRRGDSAGEPAAARHRRHAHPHRRQQQFDRRDHNRISAEQGGPRGHHGLRRAPGHPQRLRLRHRGGTGCTTQRANPGPKPRRSTSRAAAPRPKCLRTSSTPSAEPGRACWRSTTTPPRTTDPHTATTAALQRQCLVVQSFLFSSPCSKRARRSSKLSDCFARW